MTSSAQRLAVDIVTADQAHRLADFAQRHPLAYGDFASIASLMPDQPRVWSVTRGAEIVAAAIDDGLAMSVAGEPDALAQLAGHVPQVERKLVIAGRRDEVRTFVASFAATRRERPELFMQVTSPKLRGRPEPVPLRVAEQADLELLTDVRSRALEEEYAIAVEPGGSLHRELRDAVERAIAMQGIAVWIEDGRVAFTAQLIAKTPAAAMFGDLYTDPDLRGHGRATRGLIAFCGWLMSESRHVTLRVGVDNEPALRLYRRVGFDVADEFLSSLRIEAER